MEALCRIPLPEQGAAILRSIAAKAIGHSLVTDRADSINFLQTQGAGVKGTSPEVGRYATLLVGTAVSLSEGWSMLPPGLSAETENLMPPPPKPAAWVEAVGKEQSDAWMRLAVWVGCEFTAQRALPLPRIIGVDADSSPRVNANWQTLGETCFAPAVGIYWEQTRSMGVDDIYKRAAAALANPNASYSGPGSDLWQINQTNRLDLAHAFARRDPALIADMFALEEGYGEAKGSSLLSPPVHLNKTSFLHHSALGIFDLGEWPIRTDILSGSDMTIARQALRRNVLAFAGERPHLRKFAVTSGLLVEADWMKSPHSWILTSALLSPPTEPGGLRTSVAKQQSAKTLSAHFLHSSMRPEEYMEFRANAMRYNHPQNAIAQLILACDGMVTAGWSQENNAAKYLIESTEDTPERKAIAVRSAAIDAAQTTLLSVSDRTAVLRQCLSNAGQLSDGNLATNIAESISPLVNGEERETVGKTLAAILRRCQPLTPESVGKLCRSDLIFPSTAIESRLFFRVHGEGTSGDFDFGLTSAEQSRFTRVQEDLRSVRGLYYVEHRMLSILETGARAGHCPDASVLDLVGRYNPGDSAKGREKELRSLFALIAAHDHERNDLAEGEPSYVMMAVEKTPSLREARKDLAISGQLSQEERIMRLLTDATHAPASAFAAGVAVADPTVLNTLHDAHQAKVLLASILVTRDEATRVTSYAMREKAKRVISYGIREYAHGNFQEWKYTHHMSKRQLSGASPELIARWREDRAWYGETLGVALSVRESSDFGELLRHGDYPVKTCHALLSYGKEAGAGLSVLADAHSKLVQFVDPGSHRVVGRSIVRLLHSGQRNRPVVVLEMPYTMANTQTDMAMRLIGVRALAEKYSDMGIFVVPGLSAKDRDKGLVHEAERHMGRMEVWPLTAPEAMVAQQYFDSALQQTPNDDGTFDICCLPGAVEMTRDAVSLRNLPPTLCRKDPPSLLTERTPEDEEYAARCRQVFPDASERERFFTANPDTRISGTIPRGHEDRWRECLHKFPRLAEHLHHSEAVQSLIGGSPDPAGDGADARRALSVIEGRPHFRALIQGLSRKEIASARTHWLGVLGNSMDNDPSRWPPEIDYQGIAADVRTSLTAEARPARNQAFPGTDERRFPPLKEPSTTPTFDPVAGF